MSWLGVFSSRLRALFERRRLVRELDDEVCESLTMSIIAGLLGLLVALAGIRLILGIKPGDLNRLNEVGMDPQVLGSALALCLLTGILVGFAPAVTMARRSLLPSGPEGGRSIAGGIATRRIRRAGSNGIRAGDRAARWRRSADPKSVVNRERGSGVQAGAGSFRRIGSSGLHANRAAC